MMPRFPVDADLQERGLVWESGRAWPATPALTRPPGPPKTPAKSSTIAVGSFTPSLALEDSRRQRRTNRRHPPCPDDAHANTVGMAHYAAGVLYLLKGDWAKARSPIERGLEVFRAGHVLMFLRTAVASSAWVLAQLGEASEALSRMRECEQLGERLAASGVVGHRGWADQSMGARVCCSAGSTRRGAWASARSSLPGPRRVRRPRGPSARRHCNPSRSVRCRERPGPLPPALALAEPRGMRPLVAHCHLGLGRLYQRTGTRAQAHEHLSTATTMYREMDMPFWLEQAGLGAGRPPGEPTQPS